MRQLYNFAQLIDREDVGLPGAEANSSYIVDTVLPTAFIITAVLSVLFIIIGGARYIIGAGAPDQMQQAKNSILYAVVGLVVSLSALVIVRFVVNSVQ